MSAAARVVAQPDPEVLHLQGGLLVHLRGRKGAQTHFILKGCSATGELATAASQNTHQAAVDDLPGRLLHLPQLGHEVPEAGLGHHVVGGEDPHAVQRGGGVLGGGQQPPNDFVLPKLQADGQVSGVRGP